MFIIMLIKRRKHLKKGGPSFEQTLNLLHKNALSQVWVKFAHWFWRRTFLNLVNVFSLFRNYLPLEKGGALLKKNFSAHILGCFVLSLVEISLVILEKKNFLILTKYFCYFVIISPWKRPVPSFKQT